MMTMAKEENENIDLWAGHYMFAIKAIDPKVAFIDTYHAYWGPGEEDEGDENDEFSRYEDVEYSDIKMVDCLSLLEDPDYENFHTTTKQLITTIKNTKAGAAYLCPVNLESLNVRGHWGTRYFEYVGIEVMGCRLGSECVDDQEVMNNSLDFISMRAHPSLLADDKSEIIQYTADDRYYKYLDPLISQETNIHVMESTISMKNDILDLFDTSEIEVPIIEEASRTDYQRRFTNDKKLESKSYLKIFLRANNQQRLYKRENYDVLTYLGDLGGLADILRMLGGGLTGLFSVKLFHAALIGSAYRI